MSRLTSAAKAVKREYIRQVFLDNLRAIGEWRHIYDGQDAADIMTWLFLPEVEKYVSTLQFFLDRSRDLNGQPFQVLDIGCDAGHMTFSMSALGFDVSAVDFLPTPCAGQKYGEKMLHLHREYDIEYRQCNIATDLLPFPDASFDGVYMGAIIEHLPNGHKRALKEAWRVLRPGGHLILDTPNLGYFWNRLGLLRGAPICWPISGLFNDELFVGHYREFTVAEIKQMLEWSGFFVQQTKMINLSLKPQLDGFHLPFLKAARLVTAWSAAAVAGVIPGLRYVTWVAAEKKVDDYHG